MKVTDRAKMERLRQRRRGSRESRRGSTEREDGEVEDESHRERED